jgi:hypothetical protein
MLSLGYPDDSSNGVACASYGLLSYRDASGRLKSWKNSDPTAVLPGSGVVRLIAS